MRKLRKIVTFCVLVLFLLTAAAFIGFLVSPKIQNPVSDCLVGKVDPELLCWVEDFQNQFALIVSGTERERLESRLRYLKEREQVLQEMASIQGEQTPWQKLIHGDVGRGLDLVKNQKKSVKLNLLWVKTRDFLKFW